MTPVISTSGARPRSQRRRTVAAVAAALVIAPLGAAFSGAGPAVATTPPVDTTATTPLATTPTTPTTPTTTTPNLTGAATTATGNWSGIPQLVEETKFNVSVAGDIDGQATAHVALLKDVPTCPASPLYPQQIVTGNRLSLSAKGAIPITTPPTLGASYQYGTSLTPKDSGIYHLCGWVVGFPASSESSTVLRWDQAVNVANKEAQLSAEIPDAARSGDYFTVKLTGNNPGTGRRALVMAEPDKGQSCNTLVKAASGKRPLQSVVGLPSGDYTKSLRLRYRSKTAGPHLLCVQIVETVDRTPEAVASRVMNVSEGLKCTSTQTALAQRSSDLKVIRSRRDAAQQRLAAAKKKVAPARAKLTRQKKASQKRINAARKAVKRAKSKAGKKKANRRLAQVRKAENKKIYRAGAPLRKASAAVRQQERSYRQYRTGANLLMDTISRTKKDLKKYCSKA